MSSGSALLRSGLRPEVSTRERLVLAAAGEFNSAGYFGTNSNKIARAAGFAPQTFYRNFDDKVDAFVAVYERWQAEERAAIARALKSAAPDRAVARAVLDHHLEWKVFRRSLRMLAVEEPKVRRARAASRATQLDTLARLARNAGRPREELVADLLAVERLCDAVAEGELADLGLKESQALLAVTRAVRVACGG
jgi:AcrR family transcriptional regulator